MKEKYDNSKKKLTLMFAVSSFSFKSKLMDKNISKIYFFRQKNHSCM